MNAVFDQPKAATDNHKPVTDISTAQTVILIDAANFAARAYHTFCVNQRLKNSKGEASGHVYGVLRMMEALFKKLRRGPTAIVVCMEGFPAWRYNTLPVYKEHRRRMRRSDIEINPRPEQVQAMLMLPVVGAVLPTGEADDAIGSIAAQLRPTQKAYVVSTDRDVWQLMSDNVAIALDDSKAIGPDICRRKLGISPSQVPLYKAILGDSSDGIPKVPGIGAKRIVPVIAARDWRTPNDMLTDMLFPSFEKWNAKRKALTAGHISSLYRDSENIKARFSVASIIRDGHVRTEVTPNKADLVQLLNRYEIRSLDAIMGWY